MKPPRVQGARKFQEEKRMQRPANAIGIAGADEGSDGKRDVCQLHRLQGSILQSRSREVVGVFEEDGNRRSSPSLSEGSIYRFEL